MITRTWSCLNRHCRHTFDMADKMNPPCTRCGCIHTKWVPRTVGIISGKTRQTDKDVKGLSEVYGEKNWNSPRRNESAAPRHNPIPVQGKTKRFEPVAGWATEVPLDAAGNALAYCAPTGVTAKIRPTVGTAAGANPISPNSTGAVPRVEYAHRGTIER